MTRLKTLGHGAPGRRLRPGDGISEIELEYGLDEILRLTENHIRRNCPRPHHAKSGQGGLPFVWAYSSLDRGNAEPDSVL